MNGRRTFKSSAAGQQPFVLPDDLIPRLLEPLGLHARPTAAVSRAWRAAVGELRHCIPLVGGFCFDRSVAEVGILFDQSDISARRETTPTFLRRMDAIETWLPSRTFVSSVACGLDHMCLLTTCGQLFLIQAENDEPRSGKPELMRLPHDARASQVSCSNNHMAVVTVDGECFVCSAPRYELVVDTPLVKIELPEAELAAQVSCGQDFALVVSRSCKLFGLGVNRDGQLGIPQVDEDENENEDEDEAGDVDLGSYSERVRAVPLPDGVGCAVQVSCGGHFACVVTSSGMLLGCGSSHFGQLGVGTYESPEPLYLTVLPFPAGVRVASVSCGFFHTAVLTTEGTVFSAGDNKHGELGVVHGLGDDGLSPKVPTRLAIFRQLALHESLRVASVVCADGYTLARTVGGGLLAWGHNDGKQLGFDSTDGSTSPQLVPLPRGSHVMSLGSGYANKFRSCVVASLA